MTDDSKTKQPPADLKTRKKSKSRKLYWILAVLAVVTVVIIIIIVMLFHTPSYYQPLNVADKGVMSAYLTNYLMPDFYNGVQYQQPFDLVIAQSGINDVLAHFYWPKKFGSVDISDPVVFFTPAKLVVMATASFDDTELIATIVAEPEVNGDGLLNFNVTSVKLGAVDVTLLAKVFAGDLYQQKSSGKDSFGKKAIRSILYDEPFDPKFKIEDKEVRIQKVILEPKKLTLRLVPVLG